jgi:solute carrier family 25 protein 16
VAGGVAGATAKTCVAPLERCKILFQTGKLHSGGVSSTLSSILRSEGLLGLFRGNGASVLRIVPYSAIHFGLYEEYRRVLVAALYLPPPTGMNHQTVSPLLDLVAGSVAGATAVLVTYPLDLVRTRLAFQTEGRSSSRPGAGAGAGAGAPAHAPTSTATGPAATPGGVSHRPLHVIAGPDPRLSIRGVLASTLRQEGLRGMYHGIGPSMYGILPYAGLKFYIYQSLKHLYFSTFGADGHRVGGQLGAPPRLPVTAMLGFGAVAGLVAQTATYPLDVVRRRMQVEGLKLRDPGIALNPSLAAQTRLPASTPAALVEIARRQGWRTLYAGLSINYMKVVPSTAIGFAIYDALKSALDLPSNL